MTVFVPHFYLKFRAMASESKTVTVVPLNGANYPTWKVQCRMTLMKDGL